MINLSYRFNQDSSSLLLSGMPDVSNGDSEETIGIVSSWTLKIIGSPVLEGEKEHLDNLMDVILQYSRSYILGIRKTFTSKKKIVTISPFGISHKLLLNSTRKEVKPLEIIIDDAELSDLTRCLDLLRFDHRFNIKWDIKDEKPLNKKSIFNTFKNDKNYYNLFYSILVFLSTTLVLLFVPINNNYEYIESTNKTEYIPQE